VAVASSPDYTAAPPVYLRQGRTAASPIIIKCNHQTGPDVPPRRSHNVLVSYSKIICRPVFFRDGRTAGIVGRCSRGRADDVDELPAVGFGSGFGSAAECCSSASAMRNVL